MSRPIELDNGSSTQTENPGRTVGRTLVQTWLVPTVLIVLAAPELLRAAFTVVEEHGGTVPPALVAAAAGITTGVAVIAAVSARIMAIPGVERALRATPGLRWLAASEWEPDIGHDGDDSEEFEEDDLTLVEPAVLDPAGDTAFTVVDAAGVDDEPTGEGDLVELGEPEDAEAYELVEDLDQDTLERLAREETDATPPPPGWEPRH